MAARASDARLSSRSAQGQSTTEEGRAGDQACQTRPRARLLLATALSPSVRRSAPASTGLHRTLRFEHPRPQAGSHRLGCLLPPPSSADSTPGFREKKSPKRPSRLSLERFKRSIFVCTRGDHCHWAHGRWQSPSLQLPCHHPTGASLRRQMDCFPPCRLRAEAAAPS